MRNLDSLLLLSFVLVPGMLASGMTTGLRAQYGFQMKYLHNDQKTLTSFRASSGQEDTLYYMPPPGFHRGYGKAQGWVVGLFDADAATAETVKLGFQAYNKTMTGPDPKKNLGAEVSYSLFGLSTGGQSRTWLLTVATGSPKLSPIKLPSQFGLRITLPKPSPKSGQTWQQVAVSILQQQGSKIKYPSGVARTQMTFVKTGSQSAQAIGQPGSTFFFGTLLTEPTLQIYLRSTAYGGKAEDLYGPEALYPDASRGDKIGWFLNYRKFTFRQGPPIVIPLVAPSTLGTNMPTPFGELILSLNFIALTPQTLRVTGNADTGPITIPKGVRFWTQAIFIDPRKLEYRLSSAQEVRAR
jgi:hypothetical protein